MGFCGWFEMPENGNLCGAAGGRNSAESFPHFYLFNYFSIP
jgi:hypothetical protein